MSDGSQSSRPPTFAFGGHPHPLQLAQPYPYAPPLFSAPQPVEGFQLHPSYLPPPALPSSQPYLAAAGQGLQPPPVASSSQLPPFGMAFPSGSGQVTPRASFDGSGSVPTVNVNAAISTPASHRTVDGLAAGSHPSAASSSRKQAGKRRVADAFSPSNSPMPASQQLDIESRPTKRLQVDSAVELRQQPQQRPNTGSTAAGLPSLTMPWAAPPGVVTSLPSLNPGGSPMEILGQPWVFEGQDAMGAKQLFVCSLMADGPRRYQLIQQQRPAFQQPSASGYAHAPYLIPMQTLPTYRYPTASASSSLAGHAQQQQQQHMFATSPSAMLPPPTAALQQHPVYHQPHALQSAGLFLPPAAAAAAYHPHQQPQPTRAYHQLQQPQQAFQPLSLFAYANALPPMQPPSAVSSSLALPAQPTQAKLSPIAPRPPPAAEVDPETAKRNRVERWRREVSSSSGG